MSAWVKYWYLSRSSTGVSINLISGSCPTAAPTAFTRSRKLRAVPDPTLNNPLTAGLRRSDAVLDIDEIPQLAAIGVAGVVGFEEVDRAAGLDQRADFAGDGLHVALVSLVWAIHVEEFEPGPLRRSRPSPDHVVDDATVDDVLAPTISVERAQFGQSGRTLIVAEAGAAVAIGRGGRRINEAYGIDGAPLPEIESQPDIICDEKVDVRLRRRRNCRHVHNRCNLAAMPI